MAGRLWGNAGVLLLLAALVVSLPLPGSAVDIPKEVSDACKKGIAGDRDLGQHLLYCASHDREGFENCCHVLTTKFNNSTDDCTCGGLKVIAERGIDVNEVCNTTGFGDKCRAKEEEAARQAQQTAEGEEELRKIEPCATFLDRLDNGDQSFLTLLAAVACIDEVKISLASCKKPHY